MKHIGIIVIFALTITPAFADIASSSYVNSVKEGLETNIGKKLANTVATADYNKAMVTSGTGSVIPSTVTTNMIKEANVTNAKVATGIGINKLDLPTGKCGTGTSCMLIYNGDTQTYTWEVIGRGSDTAPTGGVNGSGKTN